MKTSSKIPLTAEQQAWFEEAESKREPNPCVRLYGPGPVGVTCKGCAHLFTRQFSKTFFKCGLRQVTAGAATDHRCGWRACGRFEKR